MGIRTGHTSKQAPHSELANGSDLSTALLVPRNCGVRIEPIGPG